MLFGSPLKCRKFVKFLLWCVIIKAATVVLVYGIWAERPTLYDFVGSIPVLMVIMYAVDSLRVEMVKAQYKAQPRPGGEPKERAKEP